MQTNNLPELLAPAGSFRALEAAIEGGADAVYFGGGRFNARMRAKNFDADELENAISLCHSYNVKTYITVNTRLRDTELSEALGDVEQLQDFGADALIMADLGLAARIRETFPDFPMHASTQLSGSSAAEAKVLATLGFSRMVCPRELSLRQIVALTKASPIGIEMFLHGAHCVSFSGQCMLSAAMGGRSGNRGECAQPCRLPYTVCAECKHSHSEYPLSLSDMCLAENVREIILSGVESLKIEGRQKSPEYVFGVTKMYRTLLNEKRDATQEEMDYLASLFNRDGFTSGYFHADYRNMLGVRSDEEREPLTPFDGITGKIPVQGVLRIQPNVQSTLTLTAGAKSVTVVGDVPTEARTVPLTDETARKNIAKFGATPYVLEKFTAFIGENLFVTPAQLNALRRAAVDALNVIPERRKTTESNFLPPVPEKPEKILYTAEFLSHTQIPAEAEAFFDEIYLPIRCRAKDYSVILPLYATDKTLSRTRASLALSSPKTVMVNSLAELAMAQECGIPAVASLRCNCWNTRCAAELVRLGAISVTPSPEVPLGAVRAIPYPKTVIGYGRLPLMLTLRCAISDGGANCSFAGSGGFSEGKEKNALCLAELKDRRNAAFPLVGMYDCTNVLYNSVPLYMADKMNDLRSVNPQRIHFIFSTETKEETVAVIRAYQNGDVPTYAVKRWK